MVKLVQLHQVSTDEDTEYHLLVKILYCLDKKTSWPSVSNKHFSTNKYTLLSICSDKLTPIY